MTSEKIERLADMNDYDIAYGTWDFNGEPVPVASQYRIAWCKMAAMTGYRTFYPSIIPPGTGHIDGVVSAGNVAESSATITFGAIASSVPFDFAVRTLGVANLHASAVLTLPTIASRKLRDSLIQPYLRLNCLTRAYECLWQKLTDASWSNDKPIRNALARERLQAEIDARVAHAFGLTAEELCMIYRTQFPVMRRYDMEGRYDANGRRVPKDVMKLESKLKDGEQLPEAERTWTHPQSGVEYVFEYPFEPFDRENAYREAFDAIESSID